ncbi:MAG TPA: hypothetical protein VG816_12235 [Solirubrobacterales bacterium]|nr:hypothetical protein [Solirubrobacterales bacterium]
MKANATEGRVLLARPSLCLIAVVVLFGLSALRASPAQAVTPKPAITTTEPVSSLEEPASSLEPLLFGKGEPGVETQVVDRRAFLTSGPIRFSTQHPEYEIQIFAKKACEGPIVATGSAGELEEVGIVAPAREDAMTEFSARQIDPSEPSEPSKCSLSKKYWEGTPPAEPEEEESEQGGPGGGQEGGDPPGGPTQGSGGGAHSERPLPPRLRTVPSGRANDNTPLVLGSSPGADSVKIFTNSSCSGSPVARVLPPELAGGVLVHVADNSVTDFAAIAIDADGQSFCSAPASYIEDSTPPRTHITMGPGSKTRHHKVVFRFADTSEEPLGTSFQCRVDHRKWKACHSPFKLTHLGFHRYVIRVRGTDATGNAESKPAKRSFKVIH